MHATTQQTDSRWTRFTTTIPTLTRGQWRAVFLAAIMLVSMPVMFTGGLFGSDAGTVAAEDDDEFTEPITSHALWETFEHRTVEEGTPTGYSVVDHRDDVDEIRITDETSTVGDNSIYISGDYEVRPDGQPFTSPTDQDIEWSMKKEEGEDIQLHVYEGSPDSMGDRLFDVEIRDSGEGFAYKTDSGGFSTLDGDIGAEEWVDITITDIDPDEGTYTVDWESEEGPSGSETVDMYAEGDNTDFGYDQIHLRGGAGWFDDLRVGEQVAGQVVDQNGDPVEDATLEMTGVDFETLAEELGEDGPDELLDEAESIMDDIEDIEPDTWDPDFDVESHYAEASNEYTLVHNEHDWDAGSRLTTTHLSDEIDTPRLQLESGETAIISMWDPDAGGLGIAEGPVRNSYPGHPVDGTIVIEEYAPGGGIVERNEYDTNDEITESRLTGDIDHPTVQKSFSSGFYRAYPEGQPELGYTFVVGDPQEILSVWEHDLESEYEDVVGQTEQIQDAYSDGLFERGTVTSREDGMFEAGMAEYVERVSIQGYRADGTILPAMQDPSFSDLRDVGQGDYNGSFYVGAPQRYDVPDEDATVEVFQTDELPHFGIDDYDDLQEWLEEERLDERLDDMRDDYDERLDELDRDRLEQVYDSHRVLIETVPGAEDDYLEESQFDEIQGSEDLDEDDLETETELMQDVLLGAGDFDDIGTIEPPDPIDDPIDVIDGELNAEYPIPGDLDPDSITPEIHYSDGTTDEIGEDYWHVDSSSFGTDTLVIDGYPIDDDAAAFDVRIMGASDDGMLDDRIGGVNPDFGGDLVDIDAIDFSTLAPGDDERVYAGIDADRGHDSIVDVDVFGPEGQPIDDAAVDDDRDRVSFRTEGEGDYHVRMTLESTSGHEFTVSEHIRATDTSRADPATVRVSGSPLGPHAVVGERLDTARIDGDDDPSIEAVADSGDTPGELHIHPGDTLRGSEHNIDVQVLQGSDEEQVRQHVQLFVHFDGGLGEKDLAWMDNSPITHDGDTRWGEVDHRDNGKSVLVTYTDDRGTASVNVLEDAGIVDRTVHWMSYSVPGSGVLTSILSPLLEFMSTVAATIASIEPMPAAPMTPAATPA